MLIAGLRKTSFLDYPGQPCAVVFTPYCNMNCTYCHNEEILRGGVPLVPEAEVMDYLEKRAGTLPAGSPRCNRISSRLWSGCGRWAIVSSSIPTA